MKGEIPTVYAPAVREGTAYFDQHGKPKLVRVFSDEEIGQQNIRGYAGLVQEIFQIYDHEALKWNGALSRRNLVRDAQLDPFATIGLDPSKTRDLIEGVEFALAVALTPREQQAIRLRFGLDRPEGALTTNREIAIHMGDEEGQRAISAARARNLTLRGTHRLQNAFTRRGLQSRLWGDQTAPTTSE